MCRPPRTRKPPPATKYLPRRRSCRPSSSSLYGSVRTGSGAGAGRGGGRVPSLPSEDLLHDQGALRGGSVEVGEQPFEGVAALEERLELLRGVPCRIAVQAHVIVDRRCVCVEALAPRILL